jgi:hypothetical protein
MNDNKHHKNIKILFVCKERSNIYSSSPYGYGPSYGLINSCKFIVNALLPHHIEGKVVSVFDGNGIDKEVHDFEPTHVFLEALWVTPDKAKELLTKYPKINWNVRVHSKIPFLAHEGIAIQWFREYDQIKVKGQKIHLSSNNTETIDAFERDYEIDVIYNPNIYCPPKYEDDKIKIKKHRNVLNIGCFGAIRPMKNHLLQAMAAIAFGNKSKYSINFHINNNRVEQKADGVLKNLEYAFKDTKHKLVEHPWIDHEPFIKLVRQMDLGMQVSMSESFNIVAADFVWNNIPVVGSSEISWLSHLYKSDINSIDDMISKLHFALHGKLINLQKSNYINLVEYNKRSVNSWLDSL